jgi:lysozyme family protein
MAIEHVPLDDIVKSSPLAALASMRETIDAMQRSLEAHIRKHGELSVSDGPLPPALPYLGPIDEATALESALAETLEIEGGYSDHPSDSGGKTNFGVTVGVARQAGFTGDMRDLTKAQAIDIYKRLYWTAAGCGHVATLVSGAVAEELFDTAVNAGVSRAVGFMQRVLNVLNNRGAHWPDLGVDGANGPRTMEALKALHARRGEEGIVALLKGMESLQGAFYIELAERREKDEAFVFGWLRTRIRWIGAYWRAAHA